jgi:hypothetical protein
MGAMPVFLLFVAGDSIRRFSFEASGYILGV